MHVGPSSTLCCNRGLIQLNVTASQLLQPTFKDGGGFFYETAHPVSLYGDTHLLSDRSPHFRPSHWTDQRPRGGPDECGSSGIGRHPDAYRHGCCPKRSDQRSGKLLVSQPAGRPVPVGSRVTWI